MYGLGTPEAHKPWLGATLKLHVLSSNAEFGQPDPAARLNFHVPPLVSACTGTGTSVGVGVAVRVAVTVGVIVRVAVLVGVDVPLGVAVLVGVRVGVLVGVRVGVLEAVLEPSSRSNRTTCEPAPAPDSAAASMRGESAPSVAECSTNATSAVTATVLATRKIRRRPMCANESPLLQRSPRGPLMRKHRS
jgi:hypothetical protein